MHLRFSGNGDRLAVGTPQYVHLYKLGSADVVSRTKTISVATPLTLGPIHSVRFSHSGKQVAVIGGRQSQLQLYSSDDQGSEMLGMFMCPGLLDTSSCGENEWIVLSGLPTSEPVIRIRSL
jgi:WD40 repeat protein